MMNRVSRIGMAALLVAALAASRAAWAQEEEEDESAEDDSDPCADVKNPCGGDDSDEAGEEASGDEEEAADAGEDRDEGGGKAEAGGALAAQGAMRTEASVVGRAALQEGKISLSAWFQVSLAADSSGDPLSIAPDIWYGINQKLSGGLVTSNQGQTGFWSGLRGTGLCISGDLCTTAFDNVGLEGLYALGSGASRSFALNVGFHAISFDASFFDVKLGAKGIWRSGNWGIGYAPSLFFALTERGELPDGGGNLDQLNLPVDLNYMISAKFHVGVQTGITTPLQGLGDSYAVPLALGGTYLFTPKMMFAAAFSLDRLLGGSPEGVDAPGATDTKSLSLLLGYLM